MKQKQSIIRLGTSDLDRIMDVERKAFIPLIQTTEEIIRRRLNKRHIYLGVQSGKNLIGTLALRFANFVPNFEDFCRRNPTFSEYAEKDNEKDANSVFVYSLGITPKHRNGVNARNLLQGAFDVAKQKNMEFLVGDARIPSYNGSDNLPYEKFDFNPEFHKAINDYFKTRRLPSMGLLKKDPVAGFYLRAFPEGKVLGITDENFWRGDEPCGGHMIIEYLDLRKK